MTRFEIHKVIKNLSPFDVMEIITSVYCNDIIEKAKEEVINRFDGYYLYNWDKDLKLELLDIYVSDTCLTIYTNEERAYKLKHEFESWSVFNDIWIKWYSGKRYLLGLNYYSDCFEILYRKWILSKKLNELV